MTTEWAFAFLNTAVTIFSLMYSLNIPHCNQNSTFFSCVRRSIHLFKIFQDHSQRKIILTFLCVCDFAIVKADVNAYYIVCLPFQALKLNLVEYPRFTYCYRKANKKGISWHSETWLDTDCLLVSQWETLFLKPSFWK